MAKPSWLQIDPASGSGNGSISNSASPHTGRVARTGTVTVTVTGVGVAKPVTYKVTQSPKAEFVSYDEGPEMSAPKGGGAVTVTGKTNSNKLTFKWNGEVSDVTIPEQYQANGTPTNNGTEIADDPGAQAEFAFSIALDFPKNDTVEEVERTLIVEAGGGKSAQITIKQAAGDATLSVEPVEITIPQEGTAQTVQVKSNTTWTVS